jgi:ribosomal protein S14
MSASVAHETSLKPITVSKICTTQSKSLKFAGLDQSRSQSTPLGDRLPRGLPQPEKVYVCEICKRAIGPNIPSHLLPIKVRRKQYPFRSAANKYTDPISGRIKRTDDPGGQGQEIVRELRVCRSCFDEAGPPQIE